MASDAHKAAALARKGQELVQQSFSAETMGRRYASLYRDLVPGAQRASALTEPQR